MADSSDHKPSESDTAADSNLGDRPDHMEISAASSPPPLLAAGSIPLQS